MHSPNSRRAVNRKMRAGSLVALALTLGAGATAWAQDPNAQNARVALPYNQAATTKLLQNAQFLGHQSPQTQVDLVFMLPLRNQAKLSSTLHQLYDANDKQHFHHFYTPKQFTADFGPTEDDYNTVISYAESAGFTIVKKYQGRTLLQVRASTQTVEAALGVRIDRYLLPTGRVSYTPEGIPSVPQWLSSRITGIVGLTDLAARHHHHVVSDALTRELKALQPHATATGHGPGGGFSPFDVQTAYNTPQTLKGEGQSVALYELDTYSAEDVAAYTKNFGIPNPTLTNILIGDYDGSLQDPSLDGEAEVTLDIDMVLAMAPKIGNIYYYGALNNSAGALAAYQQIADDDLANVVSTSWGISEDLITADEAATENGIFEQMASQGQTIFDAAGDDGAFDNPATPTVLQVDDPASQPFVTGVGGTTLTINDDSTYASEVAWTDGGGGISTIWPKPDYQANVQGSTAATPTKFREVPDVSLNADPNTPYAIYVGELGGWITVGGTSAAAPLWAGYTSLINQQSLSTGGSKVGFINPSIYTIGANTVTYPLSFNDIIKGGNGNAAYNAKAGFDDSTGWGTFKGTALFDQLAVPAGSVLGTISGKVTDSSGNPIVGATVTAIVASSLQPAAKTTTLADGTYSFSLQSAFIYSLTFDATGYAGTTISDITIPVTAGVATPVVENVTLPLGHVFPGSANATYSMVSAPYEFGGLADFSTLFGIANDPPIGAPNGTDPLLLTWVPGQDAYVKTPSAPADTMHLGKGYWLKLSADTPLHRQGAVAPNTSFQIVLQQGWNMIGDPYTAPVSLANISVAPINTPSASKSFATSTLIGSGQYHNLLWSYPYGGGTTLGANGYNIVNAYGTYTDSAGTSTVETTIDPYAGYWVEATQNCVMTIQAPSGS